MLESEHPAAVHQVSDVHVLVLESENKVDERIICILDTLLLIFRELINRFKISERLIDLVPICSQVDTLGDLTD